MTNENINIIGNHPDHEELAIIAEGTSSAWLRDQVLEHIKECEKCRFVLVELTRSVDEIPDLVLSAKEHPLSIAVVDEDTQSDDSEETHKKSRPWRYPGDTFNFWIAGSFLLLSLIIPRYHIHLLAAGAFFGLLAVIDYSHRNIFTPLISAWREGDEEKAKEVIEKLRDRFKVS